MLDPSSIPVSLYIHFPWCIRKCPYCDFNSHESSGSLDETRYTEQLLVDLAADSSWVNNRPIQTVFLGGGTPSLFSADAMARLLTGVAQRVDVASDAEVTMEINPGSLEQASQLSAYLKAGINRVSIGAQSFNARQLRHLGRIHGPADTVRVALAAKQAGFTRINLDLMHGLPDQTVEQALQDLDDALALPADHLSWYQLTIEPNTVFHNQPPSLPDDDTIDAINNEGARVLSNAGFSAYEISAWALPDQQCHHNSNYWQFGDYIGIGAGAHGKLTGTDQVVRTTRTRQPGDYLRSPHRKMKPVVKSERMLEFLICCLRLHAGFEASQFEARTGLPSSQLDHFLARAEQLSLITRYQDRIVPTGQGMRFHNNLLALID